MTHKTYCYFSKLRFRASVRRSKQSKKSNPSTWVNLLARNAATVSGRRPKKMRKMDEIERNQSMKFGWITKFDVTSRKNYFKALTSTRLYVINPFSSWPTTFSERMRGRIGVTWTLRIYQLPSLAHLLYRYFVLSETFENRMRWR